MYVHCGPCNRQLTGIKRQPTGIRIRTRTFGVLRRGTLPCNKMMAERVEEACVEEACVEEA